MTPSMFVDHQPFRSTTHLEAPRGWWRNRCLGNVPSQPWEQRLSHTASIRPFLFYLMSGLMMVSADLPGHGTFHDQMIELERCLQERPNDAQLYVRRASVHLEHADWQAVLVDAEHAARLGTPAVELGLLRAKALVLGEQTAAAKAELDAFIEAFPDHGPAHLERARLRMLLGDADHALEDHRKAWRLTRDPEPDLCLEVVAALLRQSLPAEALDVIQQAIHQRGPASPLLLKAMELEVQMGRFDQALARLDTLQATSPRPEPWMAKRASLLAQAGRLTDSIAAWEALLTHLQQLPNLERGSHAMQLIAEQAQQALASLRSLSSPSP